MPLFKRRTNLKDWMIEFDNNTSNFLRDAKEILKMAREEFRVKVVKAEDDIETTKINEGRTMQLLHEGQDIEAEISKRLNIAIKKHFKGRLY